MKLPNQYLTQRHLAFFHKYGFVLIKGVHNEEQIKEAKKGAQKLIQQHNKTIDGGKGEQAFGQLPQGKRSKWGRCVEPKLTNYFTFQKNHKLVESMIGQFQFKHHDGPGFYTFAPRFYNWHQNPRIANQKQEKLKSPIDIKNIPQNINQWSKQLIQKADQLGIRFSYTQHPNWHIDSIDYNKTAQFSMLWGSYINSLPNGNMGNLTVYPGTHHVIANIMRTKGPHFVYDGKKQKAKPLPNITHEGLSDGKSYDVIVQAGDVIMAHPWLAHGIGVNFSKQIRLAVYCRVISKMFYIKERTQMAGEMAGWDNKSKKVIQPKKWTGDQWANIPGLNKWLKNNQEYVIKYDDGKLFKEINKLKKS